MVITRSFLLERKMFQTKVVEKIKIHILGSTTLSRILCRLLNNMARPQMKISDGACDLHAGKLRYKHTLGV
jgi:hypothetical protein